VWLLIVIFWLAFMKDSFRAQGLCLSLNHVEGLMTHTIFVYNLVTPLRGQYHLGSSCVLVQGFILGLGFL